MPRVARAAAFACAALALAPIASAQPLTAEDRAREAFTRGLDLEARGDGPGACAAFRESLTFVRELGPVRKVAQCDARDGRVLAAAEGLRELLSRLPAEAADRAAIEAELAAAEARVAKLRLAVRADAPPALVVRVDGKTVTPGARAIDLDPGEHEIAVSAHNAPPKLVRVALAEGQTSTVEVPPASDDVPRPVRSPALKIAGITVLSIGGPCQPWGGQRRSQNEHHEPRSGRRIEDRFANPNEDGIVFVAAAEEHRAQSENRHRKGVGSRRQIQSCQRDAAEQRPARKDVGLSANVFREGPERSEGEKEDNGSRFTRADLFEQRSIADENERRKHSYRRRIPDASESIEDDPAENRKERRRRRDRQGLIRSPHRQRDGLRPDRKGRPSAAVVKALAIGPFDQIQCAQSGRREIGLHDRMRSKVYPGQHDDQHQNERKKRFGLRRVRPNGIDRPDQRPELRFLNS
jgi:hypothetical protein